MLSVTTVPLPGAESIVRAAPCASATSWRPRVPTCPSLRRRCQYVSERFVCALTPAGRRKSHRRSGDDLDHSVVQISRDSSSLRLLGVKELLLVHLGPASE